MTPRRVPFAYYVCFTDKSDASAGGSRLASFEACGRASGGTTAKKFTVCCKAGLWNLIRHPRIERKAQEPVGGQTEQTD
ncbi:MAG TPA: hypothetical protein VGM73_00450 [Candidatus Didemnitutus sp.]|jgi:hypothetical protein